MLVCTQKQNITHEIQGLVVVVNQDSTQILKKRVEKLLYLWSTSLLSKGYSPMWGPSFLSLIAPWLHGCGWRNFASWLHDFLDMDEGMDSPSYQEREPLSFHTKESIEEEMSDLGRNGCKSILPRVAGLLREERAFVFFSFLSRKPL